MAADLAAVLEPGVPSPVEGAPAPPDNAQVVAEFVATCSMLFFLAEEGRNPDVKTYWDAVHYVSTCLSVGQGNIFPVTQVGKSIGSLVMILGPSLAAKLDDQRVASDAAVVARLDAILAELKSQRAATP